MHLDTLILTCDPTLVAIVRPLLEALDISCQVRSDPQGARTASDRRHFDGLIVDCDDVPGGSQLVSQVRQARSNSTAVIVAIVNGSTSIPNILSRGATIGLSKPVTGDRMQVCLGSVLGLMQREHRRYFRYQARLPLMVTTVGGSPVAAHMLNVSEEGMAIRLNEPVSLNETVQLNFQLPSLSNPAIEVKGFVVWADDGTKAGIRFLHMPDQCRAAFQQWLSVLEAQLHLQGSPA